ncbi:hypothetical protein [Agrococcus casei]|uniref:hypothetical protein n=1 Tax=Agrococcus casei TaxID=343512 RepID=UPI003F9A977B
MISTQLSGSRGWLDAPAAASLHRIDAEIGHPLDINEAGRVWAQQNAHYQRYLAFLNGGPWAPIALPPGSSIHEFGRAIDTDEQLTSVLNRHGWRHTVYRGGVLVEPWHYEYFIENDQHRGSGGTNMAGISNEWIGERLGGSNQSGPSITDLLRELNSKVDALALDQAFTKQQLGGSGSRDTSLRQDVDKIKRKLGA